MSKQIKLLITGAVGVIILGGVLFYAQPKDKAAGDHNDMNMTASGKMLDIELDPLNYDFATISMKNGKVTKSFTVKNTQNRELYLSKLYTSCMCTSASIKIAGAEYGPFGMQGHGVLRPLDRTLAAGEEAELLVTFDPNAHGPSGIGLIERTVSLESGKGEIASVNIKANVIP